MSLMIVIAVLWLLFPTFTTVLLAGTALLLVSLV